MMFCLILFSIVFYFNLEHFKAYTPKYFKTINYICGYNPKYWNDYTGNIFQSAFKLHR